VTRTPLSRSKGQRSGHQAALLTALLTRQPAAAVSVGTYWPWEITATLHLLGSAKHFDAHRGTRGGGAYRGGRPPAYSLLLLLTAKPKFCIHLLLYGIHLWANSDRDRRVGGSRPNQNDYVFL